MNSNNNNYNNTNNNNSTIFKNDLTNKTTTNLNKYDSNNGSMNQLHGDLMQVLYKHNINIYFNLVHFM